ncbi:MULTISPECIES: RcnB family protein [Comamonas]|uniref:RcnB family protein n=1 Tax=Comamonas TaxID=283 RepID=UPI0015FD4A61|nr:MULTISPECIES: RcnB family protein [Comamonas]UUC93092.1 RcnB family protein [Comamonas sp. C11]WEE77087.1 RcnB family protein [Comamonas testosteroni]
MSRLTTRILSASVAACLGLGSLAVQAQPGPPPGRGNGHGAQDMRHGGRHDDRGRHEQRYDRRDDRRADHHDNGRRGGGPDHNWYKGSRVPPQYRSQHYVVNDWRGHHLSAPPRGYHWIQNGGDYLLVAIATGVIASMVLSAY